MVKATATHIELKRDYRKIVSSTRVLEREDGKHIPLITEDMVRDYCHNWGKSEEQIQLEGKKEKLYTKKEVWVFIYDAMNSVAPTSVIECEGWVEKNL